MIPIDYKGKTVLITGGGRGIGLALTRAFAEAGATIIITYTSTNPFEIAKAIYEEFGAIIYIYYCPGEKSDVVNEVINKIAVEVGEVDLVIANAGVSLWRDCIDMTDAELHDLMQVNLFAPLYLSRAIVRHWLKLPVSPTDPQDKGRGLRDQTLDLKKKILFISSISGLVAMTPQNQVAYNASKAGLTMAAKTLAAEWARYGIAVNAISPGYIRTDMIANPPPGQGGEWVEKWRSMAPSQRFAEAKELGDFVVLLCSDRAGTFMTGSDVVVDGGYTVW